jgi:UDPglucose 6-dehydrogenase
VTNDLLRALTGADAAILSTEWPEAVDLDLSRAASVMRGTLLVDGRYAWDAARASDAGLELAWLASSRPASAGTASS